MAESINLDYPGESFAEAISYFPSPNAFALGPVQYLEHLRLAKEAVRIPIIASLNGATPGGWIEYARLMAQAGADALELNLYRIATDADTTSAEIERQAIETVRAVKQSVTIPVAVKLSPFYAAFANLAREFDRAGADGTGRCRPGVGARVGRDGVVDLRDREAGARAQPARHCGAEPVSLLANSVAGHQLDR